MAGKKPITVLKKRRLLHLGFDPEGVAGAAELIRSLPRHYQNHAPGASDHEASVFQFYRPNFPDLERRGTPGRLYRMARAMRGYDLVVSHSEQALRAVLAHTAFADALGLPPLVHYQQRLANLKQGRWHDFKHQFAMTRTPAIVVPSEPTGRALIAAWQVPPARVHAVAPIFPKGGRQVAPDAIPRLLKRKGERWIGASASDLVGDADAVIDAVARLDPAWRLVVLGGGEAADALRRRAIAADLADRLLASDRIAGPAPVAGLFDLAVVRVHDDMLPAGLPRLIAAGVPTLVAGPEAIAPLLGEANARWRCDSDDRGALGTMLRDLASDQAALATLSKANRRFAEGAASTKAHHALFADLMGLKRLD